MAKEDHETLDRISAEFLINNSDKLLSTSTIMELLEWHYNKYLQPKE